MEANYLKYQRNKGVNLEQRIKMPQKARFEENIRFCVLSMLCVGISIYMALKYVETEQCRPGFYNTPGSVECVDCKYMLGESCIQCTDQFNCVDCVEGYYQDSGLCFAC